MNDMKIKEFSRLYLTHYTLLENDFLDTIQYVTVSDDNYSTYSPTYLKLLLNICSEIEILLSFLAKEYEPNCKKDGFGCSLVIRQHEPEIKSVNVGIIDEDINFLPWDCERYPEWWTAYNEIKHNRNGLSIDNEQLNFKHANLKNVITSLAALFSLEMFAYRKVASDNNENLFVPIIKSYFTIKNLYWENIKFGKGVVIINDNLYM